MGTRWRILRHGGLHVQTTKVGAEDGEVTLDGSYGVAVSMTPEAAEETSDRLL